MATKVVAIPNALAEYNAPLKPGSKGVSGLEVFETWMGSTRAAIGVAVGLARRISEGLALRLGGVLVKACAVR